MSYTTHAKPVHIGTKAERLAYDTGTIAHGTFWVQTSGDAGDPTVYVWTGSAWDELGGGAGAAHDILSATHTDSNAAAVVQGDVIVGDATPEWSRLARGTAHQLFKMNAGGTDPEWDTFDWDDLSGTGDMVHTHGSAAEGGQLDWDNAFSDPVHYHTSDPEGGQFTQLLGLQFADVSGSGPTRGDLIVANSTPAWARFAVGTAHQYLKMNAGGTDPAWASFDWDDAAAGASADMAHSHESAAEGGILICNGVNKTVKAAGGDYTTIQDAINFFKNKTLYGANTITVDAGTYDEAVEFSSILIAPGGTLTLVGDTRGLAGITYVDGAAMNQAALTNGGSGTCALASSTTTNANDTITVTGTGTNPDFDADSWVNGDTIMTMANAGAVATYTIASATNNVIVLTTAGPALGNDGTSMCLMPTRKVVRTTAGPCITVDGVRGVVIDGWYLDSSTGTNCHGLYITSGAYVTANNIVVRVEDRGFYATDGYSVLNCGSGAVSAWDCAYNYFANNTTVVLCYYSVAILGSSAGYFLQNGSFMQASNCVAIGCGTGYYSAHHSIMFAISATARLCTTGYYAYGNAELWGQTTNAQNSGNGANYNPSPAIPGSTEGNHYGVLYAS